MKIEDIKTIEEAVKAGLEVKWPFKRMLNGHLAVLIDPFKYSGRIVIPDKAKNTPTKGTVVAVADDITDIKVKDRVLYSQFAGYAVVFDGFPIVRVLGYQEILSILTDDAPEVVSAG